MWSNLLCHRLCTLEGVMFEVRFYWMLQLIWLSWQISLSDKLCCPQNCLCFKTNRCWQPYIQTFSVFGWNTCCDRMFSPYFFCVQPEPDADELILLTCSSLKHHSSSEEKLCWCWNEWTDNKVMSLKQLSQVQPVSSHYRAAVPAVQTWKCRHANMCHLRACKVVASAVLTKLPRAG